MARETRSTLAGHLVMLLVAFSVLVALAISGYTGKMGLRSKPGIFSAAEVKKEIENKGLRDHQWNPDGGFPNKFKAQTIRGNRIVIDHATGLMWLPSPPWFPIVTWTGAKAYIRRLNERRYAGSSHWRLPTIEELASLIEPVPNTKDRYIDSAFDSLGALGAWSADKVGGPKRMLREDKAWSVTFELGYVSGVPLQSRLFVLAVSPLLPAYAQEALWNELTEKAARLDQQGRYAEATKVAKEALKVAENTFSPDHPAVAISLNNLAVLYQLRGKDYAEAEPLHKRALVIREKALGPAHPDVAQSLNNLGALYGDQGKYSAAEPLYKRALAIYERALGPDHPKVATVSENLAKIHEKTGGKREKEKLEERTYAHEKRDGMIALGRAAKEGDIARVRALIAQGVDVNAKDRAGLTALIWAAWFGHTAIVEALLAAGADVNAKTRQGDTALKWAAQFGHTATVHALLAAGADVNAKGVTIGWTALMEAAWLGHTAIVEALLAAGADVHAKTQEGKTALIWAAEYGHTAIVEALLAAGADVHAKTQQGRTALMFAAEGGHTATVQVLRQAGARE